MSALLATAYAGSHQVLSSIGLLGQTPVPDPATPSTTNSVFSGDVETATSSFWASGLGRAVQAIAVIFAILIVIGGVFKVVQKLVKGEATKLMTTIVGTILGAAFLFNLDASIRAMVNVGSAIVSGFMSLLEGLPGIGS